MTASAGTYSTTQKVLLVVGEMENVANYFFYR